MKKIISILTILSFLINLTTVSAIKNGQDELRLVKPERNESVAGVYEVKWYMKDSDQDEIPFQIDLFTKVCNNNGTFIGTIGDNNPPVEPANNNYTYSWDTEKKVAGNTINNGNYCLRVCAVFVQNNNNYYSLCEKHSITKNDEQITPTKVNTENVSPVITSIPNNLEIFVGSTFFYQVEATDENDDTLEYRLEDTLEFLQINSETGELKSTELNNPGIYDVRVIVDDGNGGIDEQEFSLKVSEQILPFSIGIEEPKKDESYTDKILVKWSIDKVDDLEQIVISFSQNTSEWAEVISVGGDEKEYEWDISELSSGKYFLQFTIKDKEENVFEIISDQFEVKTERLTIDSLKPDPDSQTSRTKPEISVKISPVEGTTVVEEDIVALLDEKNDNIECTFENNKFTCVVLEDLDFGNHTVKVNAIDSEGDENEAKWSFEVIAQDEGSSSEGVIILFGREIPRNYINIGILLLCGSLLLLFIPWFIYYQISSRRKEKEYFGTIQDSTVYSPEVGSQDLTSNESPLVQNVEFTPVADNYSSQVEVQTPEVFTSGIGSQSMEEAPVIAQNTTYVEPEPVAESFGAPTDFSQSTDTSSNNTGGISMPSSYSDEEIPDWLKDFETDQQADNAVSPEGQDFSSAANIDSESMVHGGSGLSLNDEILSDDEN